MISIKVEGQAEVNKAIQQALKKSEEQTYKAVKASCIKVENRAKHLAPVDTGRLKSSITHEANKSDGRVGTNLEYSPYVELGTKRSQAQPFLRPALQDCKSEILQLFRDVVKGVKL